MRERTEIEKTLSGASGAREAEEEARASHEAVPGEMPTLGINWMCSQLHKKTKRGGKKLRERREVSCVTVLK